MLNKQGARTGYSMRWTIKNDWLDDESSHIIPLPLKTCGYFQGKQHLNLHALVLLLGGLLDAGSFPSVEDNWYWYQTKCRFFLKLSRFMKPICINNNLKWINLTNIGEIWNVSSRIPSRKWKTISNRRFDGDQPRTHWISCHILLDKKCVSKTFMWKIIA